ncbi:DUF1289 domain-containing protein [Denitromonas ohlonensis]|uniref:DUF1289 domain-containing protein n=2 Tax=Denitromonas TaxID=139331 RepID=A0A558CEW0_9RHOO|nr:DUF1289 domain-containing protein [Denitromonas ohlonensis]TVO78240.1 DUF1289 domain-containing protein [Denitromonas ohlonensis]TVT47309.1 MAG: DUF1289 domain-containing protein [Denitromonas halophila]TVT71661.1 MAG: DUF1289 domain-containing protein [Denitromonas halophila]TVT74054.1 MAG: DUF1289 domain-containing protein [Denitromonas halophila]
MSVASPCIDICKMDPRTGLCEGCTRTIDEITAWSRIGDDEKRAILARVAEREAALDGFESGER